MSAAAVMLFGGSAACLFLAQHPFVTYPLVLTFLARWRPAPLRLNARITDLRVAVCVCAYNEERVIHDRVQNILSLRQASPNLDVLIYVDGANDRTAEIVRGFGDSITGIISSERLGKTHGMNTLIARTHADILVFSDANVTFAPDALVRLIVPFADETVGCVCGHLRYAEGDAQAAETGSLYWRLEEHIKALESATGSVMGADGSIFAIRRHLHRPPPANLIDDMYVSLSILCNGARVVRAGDAIAYEPAVSTAGEEFRRKIRIACQSFNVHRAMWPALRRLSGARYFQVCFAQATPLALHLFPAGIGRSFCSGFGGHAGVASARQSDRVGRDRSGVDWSAAKRAFRQTAGYFVGVYRNRTWRAAILTRQTVPNMDAAGLRQIDAGCRDASRMTIRVAMVDPSLFTLPYDAALARGLQHAGCQVTLHGRARHPEDGACDGVDLAPHFYPFAESRTVRKFPKVLRLAIKGFDHFASMARLWQRLRASPPDIIHFQWLPLPLIDGKLLARFRRIAPLVLTVHDTDPFNGNPAARLQRMGVQHALSGFDRLIVHTSQGRERLLQQGASALTTVILPHGSLSSARPASADPMRGPITLMLFGKIKPYKGADILIAAFAALPPALRADVKVRIVGQPYMDLAGLRAQALALGVAQSVLIEPVFVADEDIDALFGANTIAVFPYREIEASGVLSFAIANGRPIVASRLGGFAEMLIDNVHGLVVPPNDVSALRDALSSMLADREFAAACGARVAGLAANFPQWNEIAQQTLRLYQDIAARHG